MAKELFKHIILIFPFILIHYYSYASAEEVVVFPDPMILASGVDNFKLSMKNHSSNKGEIYPIQIMLDLKGDKISGMIARYDSTVKFDQVENALNDHYIKWDTGGSKGIPFRLWRIVPETYLIGYLNFCDVNEVILNCFLNKSHPLFDSRKDDTEYRGGIKGYTLDKEAVEKEKNG